MNFSSIVLLRLIKSCEKVADLVVLVLYSANKADSVVLDTHGFISLSWRYSVPDWRAHGYLNLSLEREWNGKLQITFRIYNVDKRYVFGWCWVFDARKFENKHRKSHMFIYLAFQALQYSLNSDNNVNTLCLYVDI